MRRQARASLPSSLKFCYNNYNYNHHYHHYVTSGVVGATATQQATSSIHVVVGCRDFGGRSFSSRGPSYGLIPDSFFESKGYCSVGATIIQQIKTKVCKTRLVSDSSLINCLISLNRFRFTKQSGNNQPLKRPTQIKTNKFISSPIMNSKKHSSKSLPPISDQLLLMPGNKLSKLIKDGSVTSVRLCELFIERIKLVHSYTNSMAQDRFKEVLDEAKRIDDLLAEFRSGKQESEFTPDQLELLHSALLGVPISVKESIQIKGMRNSCGLWDRRNTIAHDDAVVVQNVRRYGMVPICTTNIPECTLYWADCQNKIYGRTRNPYDPSRVTGASSGGEGGLIGGGASVIGIGSDIAGSLRIPAHYCGIYSHKPSPFLVSPEGNFPQVKESRLRLFTIGPMTRYASDLRPLLKCLISDKNNSKQDTYHKYQPVNIQSIRKDIIQKLENPTTDLSQLKFYYFNFNESSELKGKQSIRVQEDFMEAQQEVIDHFNSKFNCQIEQINLDKYLKKVLITWQCMLCCGGLPERDTVFEPEELKDIFGIKSWLAEMVKIPLGLSKHTKESLMTMVLGSAIPKNRLKAYALCEKFEKFATEIRADMESTLGENGILVMPTLPTVAYKNNVGLLKTNNLRFTALFNVLLLPVSHATIRLDKKHKLPYGLSITAKQYNDPLTIAVAEEIELAFGGWTPPSGVADTIPAVLKETNNSTIKIEEDMRQQQAV